MQYQLIGTVSASTPIPGTTQQQLELNFGGVQVTINIEQDDAPNWLPGSAPSVLFSPAA